MSDVRSLEEVVAAASAEAKDAWDGDTDYDELYPDFLARQIAAAVREWCLAEPQIERAATSLLASLNVAEPADINAWTKLARAALLAVIGDTP